jgi:Reverse transcriptase (RNA-dependent DNA polymerase)
MIFDIKIEGFVRKARFVAGGHTTDVPESLTYSSVVSRDSVRMAFLLAALNDLDIWAADVGNAYLNAKVREKIWTITGLEFGVNNKGKVAIIEKALYGLKSSGAAWRSLFASTLVNFNFVNSIADPDVWLRAAIHPQTILECYEMVLVYVDDILHLSHNPKDLMDEIAKIYRLKEGSVGRPQRYLGANIGLYTLNDVSQAWPMSARDYLTNVVKNIEQVLAKKGEKLGGSVRTPLPKS